VDFQFHLNWSDPTAGLHSNFTVAWIEFAYEGFQSRTYGSGTRTCKLVLEDPRGPGLSSRTLDNTDHYRYNNLHRHKTEVDITIQ